MTHDRIIAAAAPRV